MASVYSTQFIAANGSSLLVTYLVPAGFLAVVRDVEAVQASVADDTAFALEEDSSSTYIAYHLFTDSYSEYHWQGRQVVQPGTVLTALSSGPNGLTVRVSGYLLQLP